MNISFVTSYNSLDIHSWSGTPYHIARSLQAQGNKLEYISDFNISFGLHAYFRWMWGKASGKYYSFLRKERVSKQYAQEVVKKIRPDTDIIFSTSTLFFPFLSIDKPKVLYSDATFNGLVELYPSYKRLYKSCIAEGEKLEKMALENCDLIIYSSDWAANSAIERYGVNPQKIKIVPFGANIQSDRDIKSVDALISQRDQNECHLLFCGVECERKRCWFALKVAKLLNNKGLKTKLHLVGMDKVPVKELPEWAINHGFISKSTDEGKAKLDEIFGKSHFLIVPTIAEAYGLVFAEANSYGVPSIATDVGGVSTIIKNDMNGQLFSADVKEDEYANFIEKIFQDKKAYQKLARKSFLEYTERLSWNVAGEKITQLLKEL